MRKINMIGLAMAVAIVPASSLILPATSAIARPHNSGPSYHNWRKGERFDRRHADRYAEIDYRRYRGLRAPPRGYHWVRSGNDAVLVAISTGIIASVIANSIH